MFGSERQKPYQKKQKAVTLYGNYLCENLGVSVLFFIIFQVKLKEVNCNEVKRTTFHPFVRDIRTMLFWSATRMIFTLWVQRWIYSTLWYTASWYPWGFFIAGQIKKWLHHCFRAKYIKQNGNYSWQFYSSHGEIFLTWLAIRKVLYLDMTNHHDYLSLIW